MACNEVLEVEAKMVFEGCPFGGIFVIFENVKVDG